MNNTPPITKNLIIINVLFFAASYVATRYGRSLDDTLGLHFFMAKDFHAYQFISYLFMHANFMHIFFNMFALWMFGRIMEYRWGPRRFLLFYFVCGIGAGLMQELVQYIMYVHEGLANYGSISISGSIMSMDTYINSWTTVGASGAIYGILLAFGMTFPNEAIYIYFIPIPIKAKYFVIGYAAIELFSGVTGSADGVAHFAHLGGMLFGLLLILYWRKRSGSSSGSWFKKSSTRRAKMDVHVNNDRASDYEYNAQKRAQSEEIDRILEKVKKSGYGSLTEEERRKLFDASQR